MKKYIIYLLLPIIIIRCSSESEIEKETITTPELNLSLINTNFNGGVFEYESNIEFENLKLIWGENENIDLDNIGDEIILEFQSNEININNLKLNKTYYFRLSGEFENELFYSNIVSLSTTKAEILFDNKIFTQTENSWTGDIEEVIKTTDGYIIVAIEGKLYSTNTILRVFKIDKQFNLQWNFFIDENTTVGDQLAGIFNLEDGNFIGIGRNILYKTYGFKFNNSGSILWIKEYSDLSKNAFDQAIYFKNNSQELRFPIYSDTTSQDNRDGYNREIVLNKNGDIISTDTIGNIFEKPISTLVYDTYGNKLSYGNYYLTPTKIITDSGVIDKYDDKNNLLWHLHYNDDVFGSDRIDKLLVTENNIINIGTEVHQYGIGSDNNDDYRLIHFRDNQGNKLWEFLETRENFLYQGNDIIEDSDGNYLYLFNDIYWVNRHIYNLATVLKSDAEGNILWTFHDGEDYNNDLFLPYKIIPDNDTYLIFGTNDGVPWLKQFKLK